MSQTSVPSVYTSRFSSYCINIARNFKLHHKLKQPVTDKQQKQNEDNDYCRNLGIRRPQIQALRVFSIFLRH